MAMFPLSRRTVFQGSQWYGYSVLLGHIGLSCVRVTGEAEFKE